MRRLTLVLMGVLALSLTACEQKQQEGPGMRVEEPNQPLTGMEQAPAPELDPFGPPTTTARPAAKPVAPERVAKPAPVREAPAASKTYVVKKGDTLMGIAREVYGDGAKWRRIYDANRGVIKDPKKLPIGAKLTIP
jgi:nucleoid-associated protein YgaU